MNKLLTVKILIILVAAYYTLLFTFVAPLHQHSDFKKHDDCSMCAVACNPAISVSASVQQLIFTLLFTLISAYVFIKSLSKFNPNLRGPPLA
jgi:hypothetical protein